MKKPDTRIKKFSAVDQVYSEMTTAIRSGLWKTDEKIPSEAELAEMYGVNRLTIRLALQKLNTIGVLETRAGEGTFVVPFKFNRYIRQAAGFYMNPDTLEDVCDFRKLVEVECARLAMEQGTPEEYERLEELQTSYADLLQQGANQADLSGDMLSALVTADLEFHYQICKMSHNSLYVRSFSCAREFIYEYLIMIVAKRWNAGQLRQKYRDNASHKDLHYVIVHSLRNKDFETCKKAYLDMVDHKIDL